MECLGFMGPQERAPTLLTAAGVHKTEKSCLPLCLEEERM
jgi:hypothetical protein